MQNESSGNEYVAERGLLGGVRQQAVDGVADDDRAPPSPGTDAQLWRDIGWYAATGIAAVDSATRHIIACNPAYARMHGFASPADLVGTSVDLLYAPEERTKIPHWLRVADTLGAHRWESVHVRSDGTRFPVAISLSPVLDAPGTVRYRVATTEDITTRRAHEDDREGLLAAERDARQRAQRLLDLTTALAQTTSVAEAAGVAVQTGLDALDARTGGIYLAGDDGMSTLVASRGFPDDVVASFGSVPPDAAVPTARVLRSGEIEVLASPAELSERYPHLADVWEGMGTRALVVLPLAVGGRLIGTLGFSFEEARVFAPDDLAFATAVAQQAAQALDRAGLFEAVERARAEADAANRAKSRFLATMSHELRTPINAALGYVQLIELGIHGPVTEEQVGALARVRKSQEILLTRINDVLAFARVEAGHVTYHIEPVNVRELFADVEPVVGSLIESKQLEYMCEPVPPELVVDADRDRLQQILLNLVSNAVKFTPPGGTITISASARATGADAKRVMEIRVRDTGVGIPPDMLASIFEPFVQAGQDNAHIQGGAGLGLAISREFALGMHGDLTAENNVGGGAVFTLTLPAPGDAHSVPSASPG